jgi:putative FmdB family regulatory protein
MPVYVYKCKDCDEVFETRHGMSFEGQTCAVCSSENVFRLPQGSLSKLNTHSLPARPGKLVDEYIEETRQEIKREKQKIRTEDSR